MKYFKQFSTLLIVIGVFLLFLFLIYDFIFNSNGFIFGKKQLLAVMLSLTIITSGLLIKHPNIFIAISRMRVKFIKKLDICESKLGICHPILNPEINQKKASLIDRIVLLVFAFYALLSFLSRWNGITPFIDLKGDAASVAGFAASLDHPIFFTNDFLLNKPQNFESHVYLHVPLVRLLSKLVEGYGLAYLVLLPPIIFIQLAGFYWLGKVIYKSRFWGFLLSVLSGLLVYTASSDYWGFYIDPQPRMLFQAFFPFVLTLAWLSTDHPRWRWLTMVMIGLLSFVHPNSIPSVAFAIWMGFLIQKPASQTWKMHSLSILAMGILFLVIVSPAFFSYFATRQIATESLDFMTASQYFSDNFRSTYNSPTVLLDFLGWMLKSGLLPLALIGTAVIAHVKEKRSDLVRLLIWILIIIMIAVALPSLELELDKVIQKLPVLLQLPRNLRYIVPLLEILALWPLAYLWKHAESSSLTTLKKVFSSIIGILIIFFSIFQFKSITRSTLFASPPSNIIDLVSCWGTGKFFCPTPSLSDQLDMIEHIRDNTPTGSRLLSIPPVDINGAIRYEALRPLILTPSDIKKLSLSDIALSYQYKAWADQWRSVSQKPKEERQQDYINLSKEFGAEYIVLSLPLPPWLTETPIYSNSSLALVKLSP